MDALAFLDLRKTPEAQPVYAVAGDEHFLRRLVVDRLTKSILMDADELARSSYEGENVDFATVRDELETISLFGGPRLVVVRDADPFVSKYRENLERLVQRKGGAGGNGTLILDVKSWPGNTRLAKMLPDAATIHCSLPKKNAAQTVRAWVANWAQATYGKKLPTNAANLLVDLAGFDLGLLDQELAKLATYVGDKASIDVTDVDKMVGRNREETAWQMLDAAAEGNVARALGVLDQLFEQGEEPLAILGAMGWQLRRIAQVARLRGDGVAMGDAFSRVGFNPFHQRAVDQYLRRLGPRALQLFDWLIEADFALKSTAQLSSRVILERLLVKLAS